jgi:hypothetical protein
LGKGGFDGYAAFSPCLIGIYEVKGEMLGIRGD